MSKNDNAPALKAEHLILILAIAGSIDAQQNPPKKLTSSQKKHLNYAYSIVDSLSSSYSMFRYFFDVVIGGNADEMHDLMQTPSCIIGITMESIFLVGFSFFAHYFKDETNDLYKKWIVTAWPYVRDVIKGLKNAYKGWRSSIAAIGLIGGSDLKFLIAPVGIILGIIAALNRIFLNYIDKQRNNKIEVNIKLLDELLREPSLLTMKISLNKMQHQSLKSRSFSFAASAFGGLIDGLYLYVGAVTLTALCPPLLIAMTSLCAFYTLACVINRLYEEHNSQLKLLRTQTQCKLVVILRELEMNNQRLECLQAIINKTPGDYIAIKHLKKEVAKVLIRFEITYEGFQKCTSSTTLTKVILGIKNGLNVYGVLASVLFLVNSILLMCGFVLPPISVIIAVSMGLLIIAGFLIHAFHKPIPKLLIHEWSEVGRSLFSGMGKGQKFVEFVGSMLQERNEDGHYQDTPLMYILGGVCALLFGLVLSLKAFFKAPKPLEWPETSNNYSKSPHPPCRAPSPHVWGEGKNEGCYIECFGQKKTGESYLGSQEVKKSSLGNEDEKIRRKSNNEGNLKIFKPQRVGESKEPDKPATDSPPTPVHQLSFFKPKLNSLSLRPSCSQDIRFSPQLH